MAVQASDLVFYLAASMPEDDSSTSGGGIDTTGRPLEGQVPDGSPEDLDVVSSDAGDTSQTLTVTYRDTSGAIKTATAALNGTTAVTAILGEAAERILKLSLDATAAGTVTVRGNTSATDYHGLAPGETLARMLFYDAESLSGSVTRYEKLFAKNNSGTDTLTNAEVQNLSDTEGVISMALAATKDDAVSVADRTTEPDAGDLVGEWTEENTKIAVPTGDLGPGEAIGVWFRQTLGADAVAGRGSWQPELSGTTA